MDYCNAYINERSLTAQCTDLTAVENAVRMLIDCLSLIDGCNGENVTVSKYYCSGLYGAALSHDHSVQNLPDKDLKRRFKLAIKTAKRWEDAALTDNNAIYFHQGQDVSWTSMSEAYEQQYPLLVNFQNSHVSEPAAAIEKQSDGIMMIESYSDSAALLKELIEKGWRKKEYSLSSSVPPRDDESILSDTDKFEPTNYRVQERVVYRRKGCNHLCYMDNFHVGESAHIEEFDEATKKQVATVKVNEDVAHHPLTKKEKERKLDVKELKKV